MTIMMKNKRFTKSITAVLAVSTLALVGCSSGGGGGGGEAVDGWSQEFAGTELNVIAEATVNSQVLEGLLPDFEKKTGIKVNLEQAPYDQLVQKAVLDYSTKRGNYDVISIPYEYLGAFASKDYLVPTDELMEKNKAAFGDGFDTSDILPELWKASSEWDGTVYGFPSNSATTMMMYRKDLFENADEQQAFKAKYGYDLAPAKTMEQYRDIAEFFTRSKGDTAAGEKLDQDLYGVAMAGKRHTATTLEWMNYSWAFGGDIFDADGMPAIASQANIDSLQYQVDLSKFAPPTFTTATWDEVTAQLQQGQAAQSLTWGDTAGSIEDESQSKTAGKMGYASIPVLKEGNDSYSHLGSWTYTVDFASKNQDAASVFLAWALSKPVQFEMAKQGGLPAIRSAFEDSDLNSELPYWSQELTSLEQARSRPRIAQWGGISDALSLQLSEALAGSKSPQAALQAAQKEATKLLDGALPVKEM